MIKSSSMDIASLSVACILMLTGCNSTNTASEVNNATRSDAMHAIANSANARIEEATPKDDLAVLQAQLEEQRQLIDSMNKSQQAQIDSLLEEQKLLQEELKKQKVTLHISPRDDTNAGKGRQATATTAYFALLNDESQFAQLDEKVFKESVIVPNREFEVIMPLSDDIKFIGIKVGLRYTKQRSQFLIPVDSINFDEPLSLSIGACDVQITSGIQPELAPSFTSKLKYYQQPLVGCH